MASLDEVIFAVDTKNEKLCLDIFKKTETPINVALPNDYTTLTYAIFKAETPLAGKLLDLGADASTFDDHKKSPLYYAVRYGFVPLVGRLLELGADPAAVVNVDGWSPFHLACSMGQTASARAMLLENGSKFVNAPSVAGHTPLHLAARGGFHVTVKELLDSGAVPDAKDVQRRQTPLHLAAQKGHTACCVLLLKNDARLHEPDVTALRKTPLELARDNRHFATAAAMLKAYNMDAE